MPYGSLIMTFWQQFSAVIARIPDAVTCVFQCVVDLLRDTLSPEARRGVAFTSAMISLSAKMAKADGVVTADEVAVVEKLFQVPPEEKRHVARLFNLAKQDIAGYEYYAKRIRALYETDMETLEDILDGLFVIATADGHLHDDELAFLQTVAAIFRVPEAAFHRIFARHAAGDARCPYAVLGLAPGADDATVKKAWRRLVSEHHPDRVQARGLPADFVRVATERVAAINAAYSAITRQAAA
nr:TerB family tellurite resistance protein [Pleomorphomonas koreensis]